MNQADSQRFQAVVLVHLDAAHNLASWLLRNPTEAEDVVQEAMLRAFSYFPSFRGVNARAWLLQIVRNAAYGVMRKTKGVHMVPLREDTDETDRFDKSVELIDPADDPEVQLLRGEAHRQVEALLNRLPVELRECLVLRELEDLSYKDIAEITAVPIGTVMSRLWRARRLLSEVAMASETASGKANGITREPVR